MNISSQIKIPTLMASLQNWFCNKFTNKRHCVKACDIVAWTWLKHGEFYLFFPHLLR